MRLGKKLLGLIEERMDGVISTWIGRSVLVCSKLQTSKLSRFYARFASCRFAREPWRASEPRTLKAERGLSRSARTSTDSRVR
jgi:hypothetical protein